MKIALYSNQEKLAKCNVMISLSQDMNLNHQSSQADFAQSLMSSICGEHFLDTSSRDSLDFHYEGLILPNKQLTIGKIYYGANVSIQTKNLKAYSISLPFQGKQQLTTRGKKYLSTTNKGLILSNSDLQNLEIDKDCKKYQVIIPERSIQLVLNELTDQNNINPVIFNPEMDIEYCVELNLWWKYIDTFLEFRTRHNGLQLWAENYEKFIIKTLLLSQENNYSTLLKSLCENKEPCYLLKVRNYIKSHAHENFQADDLYKLSGVSKTKLYNEFYNYYGTTPISFLKKYRLQQIHRTLCSSKNDKLSISKLALDWGFNHLGRFSQEYREEFGENPSDTRKKYLNLF